MLQTKVNSFVGPPTGSCFGTLNCSSRQMRGQ